MADAALLDELLRRQARAHGLASWTDPSPQEDAPDEDGYYHLDAIEGQPFVSAQTLP
jgi:hypothetical protein